jgi:hypothetical protein
MPIAVSKNWAIVDGLAAGSDYDVLLVVYMFSVGAQTPFDDLTKCANNFVLMLRKHDGGQYSPQISLMVKSDAARLPTYGEHAIARAFRHLRVRYQSAGNADRWTSGYAILA